MFTERHPERAAELTARLGVAAVDVADAAERADVLVVAVKPQDIAPVLADLAPVLRPGTLVVTLCAGLPIALFEGALPEGTPVVRVMPNTPMLVGEAMSAMSPGTHATAEQLAVVEKMLAAVGRVVQVPEAQQDAVTALSGSGPAYFFFLVEAMIDAGILLGLPRAVAAELIVQSAYGSALMLRESADHPVLLREAVTSPGGHHDRRHPRAGAPRRAGRAARRHRGRSGPFRRAGSRGAAGLTRSEEVAHPDAHLNAPTGCTHRSSSSHGPR